MTHDNFMISVNRLEVQYGIPDHYYLNNSQFNMDVYNMFAGLENNVSMCDAMMFYIPDFSEMNA